MSMSAQGRVSFDWVWKCSSGLRSASSPPIHILAGENVCIQTMTPAHRGSAVASTIAWRMASEVLRTGFHTMGSGISAAPWSTAATAWDCSATCASVSSPYNDWLPVRNQSSSSRSAWVMGSAPWS